MSGLQTGLTGLSGAWGKSLTLQGQGKGGGKLRIITRRLHFTNKIQYLKWKAWKAHYEAWKRDILINHPGLAPLVGYQVLKVETVGTLQIIGEVGN
jgi:hypothetical protein